MTDNSARAVAAQMFARIERGRRSRRCRLSDPPRVETIRAEPFTIPTPAPESDGTLTWDATTIVVCHATGGGETGLGYTYAAPATASLVNDLLRDAVTGTDALATGSSWAAMVDAIRNLGRPGIASCAIAAVDIALWDLKARLLGVSVADAVGRSHDAVPVYGSGGFTSLDDAELADQLGGWVAQGIGAVKMKVGRHPADDPRRVGVARAAIGDDAALFVDANGAYHVAQAVGLAQRFAEHGVTWFEEPVSSDDLAGLASVRAAAPPGMEVTAGEYGYDLPYFRSMLDADAVGCLQADVTRCAGITGFLRVGALADAHGVDVSAHTAPSVSAHACAGLWHLRHLEYFADHVRLESLLFDGVLEPVAGHLPPRPRPTRAGHRAQARRCRAARPMSDHDHEETDR